jgi:hypothetical protein
MDSAVDWLFRNPWMIGVVTIIVASIYGIKSEFAMRRRVQQGRCARCGSELGTETHPESVSLAGQNMVVPMCPSCRALTLRNYRAIYYLVIVGLLVALCGLTIATVEVLAKGPHLRWRDLSGLLEMLCCFAPVGIAFVWIKRSLKESVPTSRKPES